MRITAAACLLPLVLGACAGRMEATAPATVPAGEPRQPVPAAIAGSYRLQSINDQNLPVLTATWNDCREQLLSAGLVLYPDHRYVLSGTARQSCPGTPPVESRGGGAQGRYMVQGNIVRFGAEPTPVEGAAGPGWVENPPDRRFAIKDLGGTGMMAEETLTIRLEDGRLATFRKTQG